jgi:hypothetical protein
MRWKLPIWGMLAGMALLAAGPAFAHHAWGGYDMKNLTTLRGTITEFDWGNPHVCMNFDMKDANGNIEKWSAGGPSPARMSNNGWSKDTLKPGDQITVIGNSINDGSHKLRLAKVVLASGKELECYGKRFGP